MKRIKQVQFNSNFDVNNYHFAKLINGGALFSSYHKKMGDIFVPSKEIFFIEFKYSWFRNFINNLF